MMKFAALLLVGVCMCVAAPVDEPVPILSEEIVVEHDGKFHYSYESGDGTKVHEQGDVKVVDKGEVVGVRQGDYEYTGPEGKKVVVHYTADETGFHADSDVLPVAPPIPEAIARSIKYNEEHPQPQKGQPQKPQN